MRILLTGATGFIGSAFARKLREQDHALRLAVRDVDRGKRYWPDAEIVQADFANLVDSAGWQPLLADVDVVINAVGLISEHGGETFETVHVKAALALFDAAERSTVKRVIQISALGADAAATTAFHRSKRTADQALLDSDLACCIVQPSLVYGSGGSSAAQFDRMALQAFIALPGQGMQRVQPIHIDDLCDAITALLQMPIMPSRLAAVGAQCVTLRAYLSTLRNALGGGRARFVPIPAYLLEAAAIIGKYWKGAPIDPDRLSMLERGNCADVAAIRAVLGRLPRAPDQFLPPAEAAVHARAARTAAALLWLRLSVAAIWLISGIVSLGMWPVADSLAMLARCGLHGALAYAALYASAAMDIAFGVATLVLRKRLRLYRLQIGLILAYSAIIAACISELLWHPFAPIVKNLCMVAAIWLLHQAERT